jgi:hypothetical protein
MKGREVIGQVARVGDLKFLQNFSGIAYREETTRAI